MAKLTRNLLTLLNQIHLADYLQGLGGLLVHYPMQETAGGVARAINPAVTLGRDIIINGDFASDTIWTKGANWTISGGNATHAAGATADLSQNGIVLASKSYELTFTISGRTAGSVTPKLTVSGTARSTNDTFTETIVSTGTDLDFTPTTDFDGNIDSVILKQTDILASGAYPSAELLTDGDMEAVGVGDWSAINSAALTKETTNPLGGSQVLRVARNGVNNPKARQAILTIGKRYRVIGYARSDGNASPEVRGNFGVDDNLWNGTTSTDRQAFDFEFISGSAAIELQTTTSTGTEYCEFDDVSVTETNPLNGDITGATIGVAANRELGLAMSFDGSNDFLNIYSQELNSLLNPNAGTILLFAKSDTWAAGVDTLFALTVDADNEVVLSRSATNLLASYDAGGTAKQVTIASGSPADYFMLAISWDVVADEVRAYFNGVQSGSTLTGLGTWIGNLVSTKAVIGASATTPSNVLAGDETQVYSYSRALTPAEILRAARLGGVA